MSKGDGHAAAACAQVEHVGLYIRGQLVQGSLYQGFRIGARDQYVGRNPEIEAIKFTPSHQISDRFPTATAPNQFAKYVYGRRVGKLLSVCREPGTGDAQSMAEQYLRFQPCVDTVGKIAGRL